MQRLNQLPRLLLVRFWRFITFSPLHAVVALMAEQSFRKRWVKGSNPFCSAIYPVGVTGNTSDSGSEILGSNPRRGAKIRESILDFLYAGVPKWS